MKAQQTNTILIIFLTCMLLCSCSSNDDSCNIDCPEVNNTYPLLLGNWTFTGTIINGNLLIEDCDLLTTLEITCNELNFISFGGENCASSASSISSFIIQGDHVVYLDELGDDSFRQEITTLNTSTLILRNAAGTSNDVVTENWERQ